MAENSRNYLTNYRFVVLLGPDVAGFSKVSGLEYLQTWQSQGDASVNASLDILRTPNTKLFKLTLEKGLLGGNEGSDLMNRYRVGTRIKPVSVIVRNELNDVSMTLTTDEAVVSRWEISPLNAERGALAIVKFELLHTGLRVE